MEIPKEVFELIFPQGVFEWFELSQGVRDGDDTRITFVEKDIPPLSVANKHKKIIARKFHDITVTDFPLRGRRVLLTFRRRYWKLEDEPQYLKRDITMVFPGTYLEKEFADFLKAGS